MVLEGHQIFSCKDGASFQVAVACIHHAVLATFNNMRLGDIAFRALVVGGAGPRFPGRVSGCGASVPDSGSRSGVWHFGGSGVRACARAVSHSEPGPGPNPMQDRYCNDCVSASRYGCGCGCGCGCCCCGCRCRRCRCCCRCCCCRRQRRHRR